MESARRIVVFAGAANYPYIFFVERAHFHWETFLRMPRRAEKSRFQLVCDQFAAIPHKISKVSPQISAPHKTLPTKVPPPPQEKHQWLDGSIGVCFEHHRTFPDHTRAVSDTLQYFLALSRGFGGWVGVWSPK